jgi:hypothetical protein
MACCFFFWSLLAFDCFCVSCFLVALGDLSPMIFAFSLVFTCLLTRRDFRSHPKGSSPCCFTGAFASFRLRKSAELADVRLARMMTATIQFELCEEARGGMVGEADLVARRG